MLRFLALALAVLIGFGCEKDHGWQTVTDDDPRLETARQQARDSFGEFTKALKGRKAMETFTVEVKYEEGGASEYLTLDVMKVTDTEITGMVIGYPRTVKVQSGATVTVPVANLSDWSIETPEGESKGGFVNQERIRLQRGG